MKDEEQYWATIEDPKEILEHLEDKIKLYYDDIRTTGISSVWDRLYRAYYGARASTLTGDTRMFESSKLSLGGEKGEKTRLKANHLRNLARHLHQLVTQQKRNIQARASNSDYKSQAQAILGNGILDYYWREKDVGNAVKDAAELCLLYGQAFIYAPWNPRGGQKMGTDLSGQPVFEGDPEYSALSPYYVIRDPFSNSQGRQDWVIIREKVNKWNLVAEQSDEEIQQGILDSNDTFSDENLPSFQLRGKELDPAKNLVDVYTLYHKRTSAVPNGRLIKFTSEVILFDGPLPYKDIPVYPLCAEQIHDTIYGYSVLFDILGIQDGIDELHTALMTNNKTHAIQSLWLKDTDKIRVSNVSSGMKVFYSEEEPRPVQLTKSAAETYTYLDKLEETAELLSGISSTVRGNPEASLRSGNALAMVVSQSIQFASSFDAAIDRCVEQVGTGLFENIRDFSQTKRMAQIIGESQRPFAKEFAADDISEISRCVVEQINPLSKTVAGRAEIANNLLQQGLLTDPQQYYMVLSTGQLDPIMEGPQNEMLTIRAENEELRKGSSVVAVLTENHPLHIREHAKVISSPEAKKNPELVQLTLAHIQEHIDLARSMDPALAMILGVPPMPPPPGMGAPVSGIPQDQNPTQVQAEGVELPGLPSLPENAPPQAQEMMDKVNAGPPAF